MIYAKYFNYLRSLCTRTNHKHCSYPAWPDHSKLASASPVFLWLVPQRLLLLQNLHQLTLFIQWNLLTWAWNAKDISEVILVLINLSLKIRWSGVPSSSFLSDVYPMYWSHRECGPTWHVSYQAELANDNAASISSVIVWPQYSQCDQTHCLDTPT